MYSLARCSSPGGGKISSPKQRSTELAVESPKLPALKMPAVTYISTKAEYDATVASGDKILMNFTVSASPPPHDGKPQSTDSSIDACAQASWCGPCKAIAPKIDHLAEEVSGLRIYRVDVDVNPDAAEALGVTAVPTFLLYKDGKIVGEVRGAVYDKVKSMCSA